tara:strand:- start:499 stop:798 length:300 start_codon:yes stop_codon:yes gene_type:complete
MATITDSGQLSRSQLTLLKRPVSAPSATNPVVLMVLDLVGFILIFVGLGQHFERINILPSVINTNMSGLVILTVGLLLTLPFFVWAINACGSALKSISG